MFKKTHQCPSKPIQSHSQAHPRLFRHTYLPQRLLTTEIIGKNSPFCLTRAITRTMIGLCKDNCFKQDCITLGQIARGQTNLLTSGVTSPLQVAEVQNPLFTPWLSEQGENRFAAPRPHLPRPSTYRGTSLIRNRQSP